MMNGSCSTATCRSRRWQNSLHRRAKLRPSRSPHDGTLRTAGAIIAYPRKTDCGVDGIHAQPSTVVSRSSPEAASRCAEGAGLCAGHAQQLGGESPLCNLMEVKHE